MRNRAEDLGRLAVMIDHLLTHELFNTLKDAGTPPKYFLDWFNAQNVEMKNHFIHELGYRIETVQGILYTMRDIANGEDWLSKKTQSNDEDF